MVAPTPPGIAGAKLGLCISTKRSGEDKKDLRMLSRELKALEHQITVTERSKRLAQERLEYT